MNISAINTATPKTNVNFNGGMMDKMAEGFAKGYSKLGNTDTFCKLMEKSVKSDKFTTHLSTASSAVTCGLYVYKALTDEKKTKNEKITQALNQFMTFAISTALSYGVVGALGKASGKLCGKFGEAIAKKGYDAKKVDMLKDGAKQAIDLVVCSSINRFFVPVGVTPVANKLGKKLCNYLDQRDAAKAAKAQKA